MHVFMHICIVHTVTAWFNMYMYMYTGVHEHVRLMHS